MPLLALDGLAALAPGIHPEPSSNDLTNPSASLSHIPDASATVDITHQLTSTLPEQSTPANEGDASDNPPEYSLHPPPSDISVSTTIDGVPPPPYESPPPYNDRGMWSRRTDQNGMDASVVVIQTGRRPAVRGNTSLSQSPTSITSTMVFACAVFWLCGFVFGGIAFVLAVIAQRKSTSRSHLSLSRHLSRISLFISAFGIIAGLLVIIILLSIFIAPSTTPPPTAYHHMRTSPLTTTPSSTVPPCPFPIEENCYRYAANLSAVGCAKNSGLFVGQSADVYNLSTSYSCYMVDCADYPILDNLCYRFRSPWFDYVECQRLHGMFIAESSGRACYYNDCPGVEASNGKCYRTYQNITMSECQFRDSFYDFQYNLCYFV